MKKVFIIVIIALSIIIGLLTYKHYQTKTNPNSQNWAPFFLVDNHAPIKWNHNKSTNGLSVKGEFRSVRCANETCIAVGWSQEGIDDENNCNNSAQLLAVSRDKGITWDVKKLTPKLLPNGELDKGALYSVACTGSGASAICVAVGEHRVGAYPLASLGSLVVSKDGGATWSIKDTKIAGSVSCTDSGANATCVVVGRDGILVSTDGSSTFNEKNITGLTQKPTLRSVKCFGSGRAATCVAVGYYDSNDSDSYSREIPLIAISTDGGNSWQANKSATSAITQQKAASAWLDTVDCVENKENNSTTCIAGGDQILEPLLIVSYDGGVNWNINKTKTISELAQGSCIQDMTCIPGKSKPICMASSDPFIEDFRTMRNAIISSDGGETWQPIRIKDSQKTGISPILFEKYLRNK